MIEKIREELQEFKAEFSKITRSRHPFELKHFVIGQHESRWRQWYQLCIECDNKWMALQDAEAKHRISALEIEEAEIRLDKMDPVGPRLDVIQYEKAKIVLQQKKNQHERSEGYMVGALKEIQDFLSLAKTEYQEFWGKSEDSLVKESEIHYWKGRLSSQIAVDLMSFGKIQAGNLTALLQTPREVQKQILISALGKQESYNGVAIPAEKEFKKLEHL